MKLWLMFMKQYQKNWLKYALGLVTCLLIRFIPFRPPNVEPILATQMPFAKAYGKFSGFLFAFISIMLYDILTHQVGVWTFITSGTYGLLGIWASIYFKNKENNSWNYAKFAFMGTLAFDIITGLCIGPLFFHQSFIKALTGQIPFTLMHLAGNISFAVLLSPLLYRFIIENKKFKVLSIIKIFNPKQA